MIRRITVVSPQKNDPKIYNTSATTWGELRPHVEADLGSLDNMKAVIKEDRTELSSDRSLLPSGNCIILLNQVKIKAGITAAAQAIVDTVAAMRARFTKVITETVSRLRKK